MGRLKHTCQDDGGEQVLDRSECKLAMKEIRVRYPKTKDDLILNPEPHNPSGCVVRCEKKQLNDGDCYSRDTTSLIFTWNKNEVVSGPGENWRFVCRAKGKCSK